ncbi:thioredoxin [Nitritalea halalkaliphila LW7]|uniref:Thioredoxin n=1 Tax=Nitritalea halalkaliphila LW7 TaxID=1189621 RepID=I5BWE3_9BACT|nr:thioredoxin [Nitritalea halalkaliphila]EIM73895.1 thioredoxin [Nitritalea halalkaliphila LW7]
MSKQKLQALFKQQEGLILVDFYADWCAPCKTMTPILEEVVAETGGKIRLYKVNIDRNPEAARTFGVRSIPHYMLVGKGKILWRKGGYQTKRNLLQQLKGFL